ncbi:hypothetical protein ATCC90586_005392 [Pythium insidiosum]|nr:hypothetical protein ATCC90586_005392 [Pythium insidiosum]
MAPTTSNAVFVVTGANTGLGFECCKALAKEPNRLIILAGRNTERVHAAVAEVTREAAASTAVEPAIVDVASLRSVRAFCDELIRRDLQITCLVCNAGIQVKEKAVTADGFEATIATNHIGHFLMAQLLLSRTKRIMTLSSETHDQNEKTGLPAPSMADLAALSKGLEPFDGLTAYTSSKLCALLHAKEHARRYPTGPEILAFTPGFTPDTSLFRANNRLLWAIAKPIVTWISRWNGVRISTPAYSGGMMARIAASSSWAADGWTSGDYVRIDEVYAASAEACDAALGRALWEQSRCFPFVPGHAWKEVSQLHRDTVSWRAASSSFKGKSDLAMYEKPRRLQKYIDKIRKDYQKGLEARDMFVRQRSTAMWVIDGPTTRL